MFITSRSNHERDIPQAVMQMSVPNHRVGPWAWTGAGRPCPAGYGDDVEGCWPTPARRVGVSLPPRALTPTAAAAQVAATSLRPCHLLPPNRYRRVPVNESKISKLSPYTIIPKTSNPNSQSTTLKGIFRVYLGYPGDYHATPTKLTRSPSLRAGRCIVLLIKLCPCRLPLFLIAARKLLRRPLDRKLQG